MPHADVAESVEHTFMREDAIGERQFLDGIRDSIEHSFPQIPREWPSFYAANLIRPSIPVR
jgi:hypothetical protein